MLQKLQLLAVVAVATAAVAASGAFAATPDPGGYFWRSRNPSATVAFVVRDNPRRLVNTSLDSARCEEGGIISINKPIKVRRSGRFRFKGTGRFPDDSKTHVNLRGKFVTHRKAKGRAHIRSCDVTLKFTARYDSGG